MFYFPQQAEKISGGGQILAIFTKVDSGEDDLPVAGFGQVL